MVSWDILYHKIMFSKKEVAFSYMILRSGLEMK